MSNLSYTKLLIWRITSCRINMLCRRFNKKPRYYHQEGTTLRCEMAPEMGCVANSYVLFSYLFQLAAIMGTLMVIVNGTHYLENGHLMVAFKVHYSPPELKQRSCRRLCVLAWHCTYRLCPRNVSVTLKLVGWQFRRLNGLMHNFLSLDWKFWYSYVQTTKVEFLHGWTRKR